MNNFNLKSELNVSEEFVHLSVPEIEALIDRARAEIAHRKEAGKEALKVEIAEKLKSAGLDFGDIFPEFAKSASRKEKVEAPKRFVAAKYKDHVSGETWSGRGARPPQWVLSICSQRGWTLAEFKSSDEYLA